MPTDPTVDYDINVTPLYEHIGNSDWKEASNRCQQHPQEAGTWVIRYRRDSTGDDGEGTVGKTDNDTNGHNRGGVQWRFLPIHSACALRPPTYFIRSLLQSYPSGTRTLDDQGMLPLHYACGSRISREALYLLLMSYPRAALKSDPNGMLPIHYLARWGPGEEGSIDMVCVATGQEHVSNWKDGDGNTPEMLAQSAGYDGCVEVARRIREFGQGGGGGSINNTKGLTVQTNLIPPTSLPPFSPTSPPTSAPPNTDKYSSFEDESAELRKHIKDGKVLNKERQQQQQQPTPYGNENNAGNTLWNSSSTVQNSLERRAIMGKLGVSPVHRGVVPGDRGSRYHSWDGTGSVAGSSEGGSPSGESHDIDHGHSPGVVDHGAGRNRSIRSVSWDRATDPPTSISGAWTTTSAAADPPALFGSAPLQKDTITFSSSSSRSSLRLSLPPISPRTSSSTTPTGTPKWSNQHHRQYQLQNREHKSETTTDDDRRLCELREEISSLRNSGSSSVDSTRREEAEGVVSSHNSGAIVQSQHQLRVPSTTGSIGTKERSLDDDKNRVRKLMKERLSVTDNERNAIQLHERDAAIQTVRLEQKESEKRLLEEITKLKADKHRAEVALSKVTMLAPILSVSNSQSREECNDDCVSKLTFAEADESETQHDCVEIVVSPKSKKGDKTYIISVENCASSNQNNVEYLFEEQRKIESAIQQTTSGSASSSNAGTSGTSKKSNRGGSKGKKVVVVDEDDLVSTSSNSTTMTPFKAAIIAETAKRMAKLVEQVSTEKAKCSKLENQIQALKEENSASTKLHSEAVYSHLQEVKLLREGFDDAKNEIDKYRNGTEGMLQAKEDEWKIREGIFQEQIQDLQEKLRLAQNAEERKSHELMKQKEMHEMKEKAWEEKQLVLEEQIKNLREMRVSAQEVGKMEWTEMQRVLEDQIKDLEKQCSAAAQMKDKEVQWVEERERLEAEIKLLKEGKETETSFKMRNQQLESAVKDAEDVRKCNATIRKEHTREISELESELTKERNAKMESLSKIVRLEYEIVALEQELEVSRAKARQLPNDGHDDRETMYLQQISDLRRKVVELQEKSDAHSQTLVEARKASERVLQEKENECAAVIRSLKKKHETILSEQEDNHRTEIRDLKEKLENTLLTQEDHQTELRNAKKKYEAAQASEARNDGDMTYQQQISDLRRKLQELQEKDEAQSQKLWEASKLRERALQEKEEECASMVRTLKKNHETIISEQEDTHRTELRDVKKRLDEALLTKEESYLEQLHDANKKVQALIERESSLLKQVEDVKRACDDPLSSEDSNNANILKQKKDELEAILKQKNEEFENRISAITVEKDELQLELQRLLKETDGTNLVITGLETQLSLCNKELDKQRRKHRSEMNKLMNTLELQKAKEGRLQNHIHSLEKQIKDMVNEYESRLQDAFYDHM